MPFTAAQSTAASVRVATRAVGAGGLRALTTALSQHETPSGASDALVDAARRLIGALAPPFGAAWREREAECEASSSKQQCTESDSRWVWPHNLTMTTH